MYIREINSETEKGSISCQQSLPRKLLLGWAFCISHYTVSGDLRSYSSPVDSEYHTQGVGKKRKKRKKEKKKRKKGRKEK